jgi:hypothetical protein
MLKSALVALALVAVATPASALDFAVRGNVVTISGPVKMGDNARYDEFMAQPAAQNAKVFVLNSLGGTIGIALHIARDIRRRGGTTVADGRTACESACTIMFAGGVNRHYINATNLQDRLNGARGGLGFHEANNANADGRGRQYSGLGSQAITNAYYEMGIGSATSFMVKAQGRNMYRLSGQTALSNRIATSLSPP